MGINPKMLQQLQQMQNKMMKAQEELQNTTFEGSSGGGAVRVSMTGKFEVTAIKLEQEVVDPDDVALLEDLILTAMQDAFAKVTDASAQTMNSAMGGVKLPPGLGF